MIGQAVPTVEVQATGPDMPGPFYSHAIACAIAGNNSIVDPPTSSPAFNNP